MPIEFSVAAFPLGHSMIRSAYNWNKIFDNGAGTLDFLFLFSGLSGDSRRGQAAPEQLDRGLPATLRFRRGRTRPHLVVPEGKFNRAMRIDTSLVNLEDTARLPRG